LLLRPGSLPGFFSGEIPYSFYFCWNQKTESNMIKRILCLCLLFSLASGKIFSQISLVNFATGFSAPVDIKNCGDDRLFVVEQRGIIKIVDTAGVVNALPFLNIQTRVKFGSEQGLLGLAFPDDFLTSGYFYVNYTTNPDGDTQISRFHVDSLTPDSADPSSEEKLLRINQPYSNHNGGHIAFGPDGYLYIGMGDGGSGGDPQNRSQNPDTLLGKMLRIAVDPSDSLYSIPPGNPFALDTSLGRPEIWSLGLRNPWRFSFDRLTGDMWIGDVGQDVVEEVDMEPAGSPGGLNYGWRCYEGNVVFNANGCLPMSNYVPPVHQYNQNPTGYCSVTGGYIYRGARFQELYGKYFYADYCISQIQYLYANGSGGYTNVNLGSLGASSITTFGEDKNGEIYCAGGSTVYRITSADCTPVSTINNGVDTVDDCGTTQALLSVPAGMGYDYLWMLNADTVSVTSTCIALQPGTYILQVTNQGCTSTDTVYVNFTSNFNLTFTGLDTLYCVGDAPANLSPNYLGGTFTGSGMTNATFSPADAGIGTHTITYTYTHTSGCVYDYSQDTRVDACLGIPERSMIESLSVYPNPARDLIIVSAYTFSGGNVTMSIADLTGRVVKDELLKFLPGENSIPVALSLMSGIYNVTLNDGKGVETIKLIVN
jgi:glucose/arabinose dehydrogenase